MTTETTVRRLVDKFCADIIPLVRAQLLQEVEAKLLAAVEPALPPPRRKPAYKALPAGPSLTEAEDRTLKVLASAGVPQTTWDMAKRLDRSESAVRYQLMRLLKKKAVRRWEADDGRIVYKSY